MNNDIIKTGIIGKSHLSIRQWNEGASFKIGAFCSLADNITIF
jgi:hypothetical protein